MDNHVQTWLFLTLFAPAGEGAKQWGCHRRAVMTQERREPRARPQGRLLWAAAGLRLHRAHGGWGVP